MVKAFNKKESKRMTCHKKYKIRKKVREHNKKLAKTLKNSVKKKKKIDGNVPNLAPFKEELLLEAMQQNEMKNEEKMKKKTKTPATSINKQKSDTPQAISSKSVSSHVTVSQCDILIWVIDIRSAIECYCEETFTEIKNANKYVVVVLNKVDLVPSSVVQHWYSWYSSKAPTFVTKSTEVILTECEQIIPALKQTVAKFGGAKPLLNHLKQSFTEGIKKLGVIGGPQVGKSCLISTILKCCGRTKAKKTSETKLNENLKLVTVPGLVKIEYKGILEVLQNMPRYMNHPVEVLRALSLCITKQDAMLTFTLPDYNHPDEILDALAVRYNLYYNKESDHVAVGRLVLKQLRDKKLKFYVPTLHSDTADTATVTQIPEDILEDVEKFLFRGDALSIPSSELNIVIVKKEKKKRNNEMEVDEESEVEDEEDMGSSEDEGEEEDSSEEEDMC